jgi:hypothetical protein
MAKHILGGVQRLTGLPLVIAEAFGDLQTGFDLGDLGRADSFNGTNLARRCVFQSLETIE